MNVLFLHFVLQYDKPLVVSLFCVMHFGELIRGLSGQHLMRPVGSGHMQLAAVCVVSVVDGYAGCSTEHV